VIDLAFLSVIQRLALRDARPLSPPPASSLAPHHADNPAQQIQCDRLTFRCKPRLVRRNAQWPHVARDRA
jgi:hypothetical protein